MFNTRSYILVCMMRTIDWRPHKSYSCCFLAEIDTEVDGLPMGPLVIMIALQHFVKGGSLLQPRKYLVAECELIALLTAIPSLVNSKTSLRKDSCTPSSFNWCDI